MGRWTSVWGRPLGLVSLVGEGFAVFLQRQVPNPMKEVQSRHKVCALSVSKCR